MKLIGINKDVNPIDTPPNQYKGARNIVIEKEGAKSNEKGFDIILANIFTDEDRPVGVIESPDGIAIIFRLIQATNVSEIGILQFVGGTYVYTVMLNTNAGEFGLNFSTSYQISGEVYKNVLGEYIVAFVDDLNKPRVLNINKLPFEVDVNKFPVNPEQNVLTKMFPDIKIPFFKLQEVNSGGQLVAGVYYPIIRYIFNDNTKTDWYSIGAPVTIVESKRSESFLDFKGSKGNTPTDKSITFRLRNIDTNFPRYQLGMVKKIGGIESAVAEQEYYTTQVDIIYTGREDAETISLTDILINNTVYDNIHSLTQLNRRLYAANTKSRDDLGYQPYANNIVVNWVTQEIGLNSLKDSYKNEVVIYTEKGFMPDEVYALTIQFLYKDGGYSQAFHIPGRLPQPGETALVSNPTLQAIDVTAKNFHFFNYSAADGTMGYWEDEELYPTTSDFVGLAGTPVRHHKFPSTSNLESWGLGLNVSGTSVVNAFPLIADENQKKAVVFDNTQDYEMDVPWGVAVVGSNGYGTFGMAKEGSRYNTAVLYTAIKRHVVNIRLDWSVNNILGAIGSGLLGATTVEFLGIRIQGKILRGDEEYTFYDFYDYKDTTDLSAGAIVGWESESYKFFDKRDFNLSLKEGDKVEITGTIYGKAVSLSTVVLGVPVVLLLRQRAQNISSIVFNVIQDGSLESNVPSTDTARVLGLSLSNIVIPSDIQEKVQGYQIGYVKRDYSKATVLAKCFMYPNNFINGSGDNKLRLYNPDIELRKPSVSPTYITEDYNVQFGTNVYSPIIPNVITEIKEGSFEYIPANNSAVDNAGRESCAIIETTTNITYPTEVITSAAGGQIVVPANVVRRDYYKVVTLKQLNKNVYNNFYNQEVVLINNIIRIPTTGTPDTTTPDLYGGDVFKNYYAFRIYVNPDRYNTAQSDINRYLLHRDFMFFGIIDTISNAGLRYTDTEENKFTHAPISSSIPAEYNIKRQYTGIITDDRKYANKEVDELYDNYNSLLYNSDYSSLHDLNTLIPLGITPTTTVHPYRVHRALPIGTEEQEIKWRNFLPIDYVEQETNKGVIWNIQAHNSQLIIHHTETLFRTQPIERLNLESTSAVIGTGDIFEFPPQELRPSNQGYAGTYSQHGAILTKFGYVFYDEARGALYILDGKLDDLSVKGLKDYYRDRMFINTNRNLDEVNFDNQKVADNPINGKGITMAYDEYYNRLILTLRRAGTYHTLSYDFGSQTWQSFHDYEANFLFNLNNNLFSFNNGVLYKHNSLLNKGLYYLEDGIRTPKESWIDVVFNTHVLNNKYFYGVNWLSEVTSDIGTYLHTDTITQILVYNSYQSSQVIDVTKLRGLAIEYTARDTGGKWNFNKFRDIVTNEVRTGVQAILDEDDNFINNSVTNQKAWFNKKRFIDNFIVVRFIYSNSENKTLYLYDVDTNKRLAPR